jgi:hypothetical protein
MRLFRGLAGALLGIVSLLLLLVGALLCATVVLLPVGIPLLGYALRTFTTAIRLMLPRAVSHPAKTAGKAIKGRGGRATKRARQDAAVARPDVKTIRRRSRKTAKRVRKKLPLIS